MFLGGDFPLADLPLAGDLPGGAVVTLAGTAQAVASGSGGLSHPARLAGAGSSIATATAALSAPARLAANAAGVATAVGALRQTVRLAGAAAGLTTATGTLGGSGITLAGNALVQAAGSGALSHPARLAGVAAGIVTATGTLGEGGVVLAGNALAQAAGSGTLFQPARLAGFASATATARATIGPVTGPSTPPVFILTAQARTFILPGKRKSMRPFRLPDKPVSADFTYRLDFSQWEWLQNGDTIVSATAPVIAGDVDTDVTANTASSVTIRLSGGTKDTLSQISVRCLMLSGETLTQTLLLDIIP